MKSPDDLYLLYEDIQCIEIENYGEQNEAHFIFNMYVNGEIEQRLHLIEAKNSTRDTLNLSQISNKKLRDYNWLEKSFNEYYHFDSDSTPRSDPNNTARYFDLNKLYQNVYVVNVDSVQNIAVIYKVEQNIVTDYDGLNIEVRDSTGQ